MSGNKYYAIRKPKEDRQVDKLTDTKPLYEQNKTFRTIKLTRLLTTHTPRLPMIKSPIIQHPCPVRRDRNSSADLVLELRLLEYFHVMARPSKPDSCAETCDAGAYNADLKGHLYLSFWPC
jgi:hypothetical protein